MIFNADLKYRLNLAKRYPQHKIGRGTYGSPYIYYLGDPCRLEIGNYCSIAPGVTIILGVDHKTDIITTYPLGILYKSVRHMNNSCTKGDIIIGSDVWIGYGATILSGVTIGHGAVIGANAVVSKDVAPYAVVVGNPAREVRKRFPDDVIERLLETRWWDLDEAAIDRLAPLLMGSDVEKFLSAIADFRAANGATGGNCRCP